MRMRVVGIDVGKEGAIAIIGPNNAYNAVDMPIFKVKKGKSIKKFLDEAALLKLIREIHGIYPITLCAVERQIPFIKKSSRGFGGMGVVSAFSSGEQVGVIKGILRTLGIPFELVLPQRWRKEFNLASGGNTKHVAYDKACSLFPNIELKTPRGRIKDGQCDSLLLCEFARRMKMAKGEIR
ncbi:MAG: hypothetical protein HQ594_06150 [Candidatus Omnitrophica bacterium]|nr:hypothetical protein [Candidatus Omnitrophota bacterium]